MNVKVVITAHRLCDNLPLRAITRGGSTIVIGMGSSGIPSRVLASQFGSIWTYAGNGVAPGQVPVARMLDDLRFRDISVSTAIYGIVGTMTAESKSPSIHNPWFAAAGIDAVFVPLPTPEFADFLEFAEALPVTGAGVTIPFKLDALRAAAEARRHAMTQQSRGTERGDVTAADRVDVRFDVRVVVIPAVAAVAAAHLRLGVAQLHGAGRPTVDVDGERAMRRIEERQVEMRVRDAHESSDVDGARSCAARRAAIAPFMTSRILRRASFA